MIRPKMLQNICKSWKQLLALGIVATSAGGAAAQSSCAPCYSVVPQTVYEQRVEKRLRPVWDWVYEEQEVTTYRPVLKERFEQRSYQKSIPMVETSTVEDRYTVRTPVTKRDWIDQNYQETSMVTETSEREETYMSYRPRTETYMQTQSHVVQRPVTETQMTTQQYTTYQPVTTYQAAMVDQGQYVAQPHYTPGDTRYGLRWMQPGLSSDPYGNMGYRRGGLGWVPYTSPGTMNAQVYYQPNPVQVAVPQTSLMPQVQNVQVPVQVTRLQNEVVQTQVPYNVTRMEPVYESRKVPVTVQKPVTQTLTRKVPVDRVEWVEQVMVRPRTTERTTYKVETVTQNVPVKYYENEAIKSKITVPKRQLRYESYDVTVHVPHIVQSPTVLSYSDPYSATSTWNSAAPPSPTEKVTYGAAKPLVEEPRNSDSGNAAKKPEVVDPPAEVGSQDLELSPSDTNKG